MLNHYLTEPVGDVSNLKLLLFPLLYDKINFVFKGTVFLYHPLNAVGKSYWSISVVGGKTKLLSRLTCSRLGCVWLNFTKLSCLIRWGMFFTYEHIVTVYFI
jgi:hypothetical protein